MYQICTKTHCAKPLHFVEVVFCLARSRLKRHFSMDVGLALSTSRSKRRLSHIPSCSANALGVSLFLSRYTRSFKANSERWTFEVYSQTGIVALLILSKQNADGALIPSLWQSSVAVRPLSRSNRQFDCADFQIRQGQMPLWLRRAGLNRQTKSAVDFGHLFACSVIASEF